ncbi:hypothetical protein Z950_4194 [Sulfitobacter mediterraneus KCTC 32188]|nr:hypothetical protein Z950_4194 [Sulfitobacter mediterraneus KCTC 32188]
MHRLEPCAPLGQPLGQVKRRARYADHHGQATDNTAQKFRAALTRRVGAAAIQ